MRRVRMAGALALTLCALGYFAVPAHAAPAPQGEGEIVSKIQAAHIESVAADSSKTATLVTITADRPLSYTSYDPDDETMVIEFPVADASAVARDIVVETPQLDRIQVSGFKSSKGTPNARLEFHGRHAARTRIVPRGYDLVVIFEGTSGTVEDSAPQPQEAPAQAQPPESGTSATESGTSATESGTSATESGT
ncbi:MAG: hypothetical protein ACE5HU_07945, partial [Acidobacteriota bacterium]